MVGNFNRESDCSARNSQAGILTGSEMDRSITAVLSVSEWALYGILAGFPRAPGGRRIFRVLLGVSALGLLLLLLLLLRQLAAPSGASAS